jgi:DNA-binding MarR family transcriptional regulator
MAGRAEVDEVAGALHLSVSLLMRRLRARKPEDGGVSMPESSALSRLERGGPATPTELARLEQISPQSMSTIIAGLESSRLVERRPDPDDGRRVVLSITEAGREAMRVRRTAVSEKIAGGLADGFTSADLEVLKAAAPLIERLAEKI